MNICNPLRRVACVMALSACAVAPALAKESGFYIGAGLGQSAYDSDAERIGVFTIVTESSEDSTDLGFSLSGGYRFNPYIGVELSLNDFGDLTATEAGFGNANFTPVVPTTSGGYADAELGTRGVALAVVGAFPVQNFEFFGKVGVMRAETTYSDRIAATFGTWPAGSTGILNVSSESTTALYGLGMGYTFADEFFVKLEWMRVPKVAEKDDEIGTDLDVDVISLGFQFRF